MSRSGFSYFQAGYGSTRIGGDPSCIDARGGAVGAEGGVDTSPAPAATSPPVLRRAAMDFSPTRSLKTKVSLGAGVLDAEGTSAAEDRKGLRVA